MKCIVSFASEHEMLSKIQVSLHLPYFFDSKMEVFPSQNHPKNLDLS